MEAESMEYVASRKIMKMVREGWSNKMGDNSFYHIFIFFNIYTKNVGVYIKLNIKLTVHEHKINR